MTGIIKQSDFTRDYDLANFIQQREVPIESRVEPLGFRASSIGSCLRSQWYDYNMNAVERDIDFITGAADHGNYVHDMMKKKFTKAGLWRGEEIPLSDRKLRFTGHIDLIIEYESKLAIVEFKSMKSSGYLDYIRKPYHHHRLQLQSYMMLSGITTGYLSPYNKDTDDWTLLKFGVISEEVNEVINRLKLLRHFADNNIRPEKCPHNDRECGWCRNKAQCRIDG